MINTDWELISSHDGMCSVAVEYYTNIFSDDLSRNTAESSSRRRVVTADQNAKLISVFKFEEFTTVVNQMHPDKSAFLKPSWILARISFNIFGTFLD